MRTIALLGCAWACLAAAPALAQDDRDDTEALMPAGFGSLKQSDLALRVGTEELEVRLVPLDERVTRLLARDSYESLQSLVHSRRSTIDSLARLAGISAPGLALVTFFGGREGARFDPSTLSLGIRSQELRPRGIVPFTPRFTSQQLNLREQVSAVFLFEELLPVTDDFTFSYQGRTSEDWRNKQVVLDRERSRVAARSRLTRPDSGAAARR
ncbi:MAG: hypothetical protein H0T50_01290 [Gemmatimonadales bacterium]|nr:hypothetical protein [Gemmatimonadales bacterium]